MLARDGEPHKWFVHVHLPTANSAGSLFWLPRLGRGSKYDIAQGSRVPIHTQRAQPMPPHGHIRRRGVKIVPTLVSHQSHRCGDSGRRVRMVDEEDEEGGAGGSAYRPPTRPPPESPRGAGRAGVSRLEQGDILVVVPQLLHTWWAGCRSNRG